jgi:hypothetical protein
MDGYRRVREDLGLVLSQWENQARIFEVMSPSGGGR